MQEWAVVGGFLEGSEGAQVHPKAMAVPVPMLVLILVLILLGRGDGEARRSVRDFGEAWVGVLGVLGIDVRHVIEMRVQGYGDGGQGGDQRGDELWRSWIDVTLCAARERLAPATTAEQGGLRGFRHGRAFVQMHGVQ